jgi:hypothetical protein
MTIGGKSQCSLDTGLCWGLYNLHRHVKPRGKKYVHEEAEDLESDSQKKASGQAGWVPVAHSCNPYLLERQRSGGLKPAQANSLRDSTLKKAYHKKRAGGLTQVVEFKKKKDIKPQQSCVFARSPRNGLFLHFTN